MRYIGRIPFFISLTTVYSIQYTVQYTVRAPIDRSNNQSPHIILLYPLLYKSIKSPEASVVVMMMIDIHTVLILASLKVENTKILKYCTRVCLLEEHACVWCVG